ATLASWSRVVTMISSPGRSSRPMERARAKVMVVIFWPKTTSLGTQLKKSAIAAARAAMADFFNCVPNEVVFGQNMTTITFALARSIGRELRPGDEIIVTTLDHD